MLQDVAMELQGIAINSPKLGDLLQSKVAEGTRKLHTKLAHLEKIIQKIQKGAQKALQKKAANTITAAPAKNPERCPEIQRLQ
jgi:hypothetical protein